MNAFLDITGEVKYEHLQETAYAWGIHGLIEINDMYDF